MSMPLPLNNLSYPIRLEFKDSLATGFIMRQNEKIFLVSAAHSFYDDNEDLQEQCIAISYTQDIRDNKTWEFNINIELIESIGYFFEHETEDVAAIHFANIRDGLFFVCEGIEVIKSEDDILTVITEASLKTIDEVVISSDVYVLGYPSSIGLEDIPQIDFEKPLVKKGVVAGVNFDKKTIVLDCEIYKGNSGGPVIQSIQTALGTYEFKLIGIITELVPIKQDIKIDGYVESTGTAYINSGYSIAVSIDAILEMVQ